MYLHKLTISGYKTFGDGFELDLSTGLNVLVGENGVGKSAIVDAVRLLLLEDEFGRSPILDTDFHKPFLHGARRADGFRIVATFSSLTKEEQVVFLPWSDLAGTASLTLHVDNKPNYRGRYRRTLWGGASSASFFEWEILDTVNCIYLPPLRDAEAKLREGRGSRLARLMKNLTSKEREELERKGEEHPLEREVADFNRELAKDDRFVISTTNELIRKRLKEALGAVFSQDTLIQFSEANFNRIVESLRLLFFPETARSVDQEAFRALEENSLGYNNLLYLATVLAELVDVDGETSYLKILLIEEPEAHLHPQLQIRLLEYLERAAHSSSVQVVVTTHSPVLASAASLDSVIRLTHADRELGEEPTSNVATPLRRCGLAPRSKRFVQRWLDVTKSALLFAKGVILVEGIAEAMLLPVLARKILKTHNENNKDCPLPESLEDAGVSVINMNGIYFEHFMPLFCDLGDDASESIPTRCAGITDQDPPKTIPNKDKGKKETDFVPTPDDVDKAQSKDGRTVFRYPPQLLENRDEYEQPPRFHGRNPALELIPRIGKSEHARLYSCRLKTFEYDLAMEGDNLKPMLDVLVKLWSAEGPVRQELSRLSKKTWGKASDQSKKARASSELLRRIEDSTVGKGLFAQGLVDKLVANDGELAIPEYIRQAVIWACGGRPDEKK